MSTKPKYRILDRNSVNIGRHVAILEKKGSATINYHPGTLIQEPAISKAEIERVSPCPLPELDTSQKNLIQRGTLTEAIDWKIFVTCTLKSWHLMDLSQNLDKDEERQLFQAYPVIEPTNSYHDAFEFIIVSVLSSLYQNTGAGLNPDEQLGFFERVFLVTKLRTLTQLEKTSVEENLRRHGLYATLKNYILNWYISNTYFQYFDYSKNPDGGYKAARLWGDVWYEVPQARDGINYRIIDPDIRGHVLSGKTGGRQTRLNRLRALLPEEEARYRQIANLRKYYQDYFEYRDAFFAYGMEFQFYLPIKKFKRDAAGEITNNTITPHPTVSVLVEKSGRRFIEKIPLKHRFTHDASIMIPEIRIISVELDIQKVELERFPGGLVSLRGFPAKMKFQAGNADLRRLFGTQNPPKGEYRGIRITLGNQSKQSLSIGQNNRRISLENPNSSNNTLLLSGSFYLRGGMVTELLLEGQTTGGKSLLPLLIWSDSSSRLRDRVAIQSVKGLGETVEEVELDIQEVELIPPNRGLVFLRGFPAKMKFQAGNADLRRLFGDQLSPKGSYEEIRITLGGRSTQTLLIRQNDRIIPLEYQSPQNILRLVGHFSLWGGKVAELLLEGQTTGGQSLQPLLVESGSSSRLRDRVAIQSVKGLGETVEEVELDIQEVELISPNRGLVFLRGFPAKMKFQAGNADLRRLFGTQNPPKGEYSGIIITLGNQSKQSLSIGQNNRRISLENPNSSNNTLLLSGSFYLRGGMVTELLLEGQTTKKKSLQPLLIQWDDKYMRKSMAYIKSVKSLFKVYENRLRAVLGNELEEMIEEAEIILRGRVVGKSMRLAPDFRGNQEIYSFLRIRVNDSLKGTKRNGDVFTLQMIGGRVGNMSLTVSHMPVFELNEESMIFLKQYPDRLGVIRGDRGKISF